MHYHAIQTANSKWSNLVQLTTIGDDVHDRLAPPYATILEEFVDVFHLLPSGLPPEQ